MTFRRYGRSTHLRLGTAADLAHALELDRARWVATVAPLTALNGDTGLPALLAAPGAQRLTCEDVADGIRWMLATLRDTTGVDDGSDRLHAALINPEAPDGPAILEALRRMLHRLGRTADEAATLAEVRRIKSQVESTPVSACGIVLPQAVADGALRGFIADIIATTGGAPHPSGQPGVGPAELDRFLAASAAWLAWHDRGACPEGSATEICPLGAATAEAYDALEAVRAKVDLFFAQCEAAALDERLVGRMGWTEAELAQLDLDDASAIERLLREAPLAAPTPRRVLDLGGPVNPYHADALGRFVRLAAAPALGEAPAALSAAQWRQVKAFYEPRRRWLAERPDTPAATLGAQTLRAYQDGRFAAAVRERIAAGQATALELDAIHLTEKLLACQAHLLDLTRNFVSFPHLYEPGRRAMFEMGSLVMDGRRFDLAIRAEDVKAHAAVAASSGMFLLYLQLEGPAGPPPVELAVPVTSGGRGNLSVGKRGVFYDVHGVETPARVVHIVDNPISLREAVVAPFRRLGKLFTGKIEALTATAEKQLDAQAQAAMAPKAAAPAAAAPSPMLGGGMLMGAGVAIAALSSALAYIAKVASDAGAWSMLWGLLGGVLAAALLVMIPTTILAFGRLRRRDLSAILEGSGWAINARMRLTHRQSITFTHRPPYPRGSRIEGRRVWLWIVALALVSSGVVGGAITAALKLLGR
ncbi:MAG: hypothetical protein GX591_19770 [Planctomycetes bacterium]|nr:hypothetical protein [Planctomycetota bacterium]